MFKNWKCKLFGHKRSNHAKFVRWNSIEFTCIRCGYKWLK
ncbi:DUF1660 family phage protein [Peribacillus asahii]